MESKVQISLKSGVTRQLLLVPSVKSFHIFGQQHRLLLLFSLPTLLYKYSTCYQATKRGIKFLTDGLSCLRYEDHFKINTTNVLFLGKYQHRNHMRLHTSCNCSIPSRNSLWQQITRKYIILLFWNFWQINR